MANVLICSLSDRPTFSGPMFLQMKKYCDKHGYKCVFECETLESSRSIPWSKVLLLQREMKNNPDIEYIVWIDDDILICDINKKLEDFFSKYPFENLLICDDIIRNPFNTGFMVFKNNDTSYNILQSVWNLADCEEHGKWKHKANWEQECFIIYYNQLSDGESQNQIKIIPHRTLQSIHRTYKEGDFSIHFAGIHDMTKRMQMRDDILKQINVLQQ